MVFEVNFLEEQEAALFYRLVKEADQWTALRKRNKKNTIRAVPAAEMEGEDQRNLIARLLTQVFIECREMGMIQHVLQKKYHFSMEAEIDKITSIAVSLLEKDEAFYEDKVHRHELRDSLTAIFQLQVNQEKILFDSIVQFRLYYYYEQLTDLVGLAIDEFKREEEYQDFIQSIRDFISRKIPEVEAVHVLQGEQFQIYQDNGERYTREDFQQLQSLFPLFIFGLEQEEWDISPLIMLSPNQIFIYGEDPYEPRTHTIMNIFQEKTSFYDREYFPFPLVKDS
ncbi:putative sporulation protein YtxC [Gracilibacillus alcaliphilus]|uniref:putative sporulation protein YtxC n=1 Tax=Gracilibacillus alcaliphilus TaxID=1401441 RepID=UPI001957B095|nr:putative sporulation protein YtxC [Gracilibacillus alcaliphilus]MBM7676922.1 putative sporulation protein YtxC [Gracilibacillus alcaliphilus]